MLYDLNFKRLCSTTSLYLGTGHQHPHNGSSMAWNSCSWQDESPAHCSQHMTLWLGHFHDQSRHLKMPWHLKIKYCTGKVCDSIQSFGCEHTYCWKSQLSADHTSISSAPSIITDCTPNTTQTYFHSSLSRNTSAPQTNLPFIEAVWSFQRKS